MLNVLRRVVLVLAACCGVLLVLVVLNLVQSGHPRLERLRDITWTLYGLLALYALLQADRAAFAARWTARLGALLGHHRFFPVMAAVMLVLYGIAALTRHWAFGTSSHDFSMFDEALYHSWHGRPLYSPVLGRSFLGEHFSPFLFLLVPLHALVRSPYLLVLVQPLALWSAVFVLRSLLVRQGLPVATTHFACLVFLNCQVQITTLAFLFHVECFVPLLLLGLYRQYRHGPAWGYWLLLVLALSLKEDVGIYLTGFALYAALVDGRRALGMATALACVAWVLLAVGVAIPHFRGGQQEYVFLARWQHWGAGPWGALAGMATHPLDVLRALLAPRYLRFFADLLFVPFFAPWAWLILAVPWALNATSGLGMQARLALYYGIPIFTVATIAGVLGLGTESWRRLERSRVLPWLAALAFVLNVSSMSFWAIPRTRPRFLAELRLIPATAPVQAMSCFYPVLGYARPKTLIETGTRLDAAYAVLRTDGTRWPLAEGEAQRLVDGALRSGRYENLSTVPHFYILRRRPAALGG